MDNPNAGGCAIFYSAKIAKLFPSITAHTIVPGRCHCIDLCGSQGRLKIFNLHLDPDLRTPDKKRVISQIARIMLEPAYCTCVIAGDFNYQANGEARSDLAGQLTFRSSSMHQHFARVLPQLAEVAQDRYTHRCVRGSEINLGRNDRIYTNMFSAVLVDLNPRSFIIGDPAYPGELSDHVPVVLVLCPSTSSGQRGIPKWVSRHPSFPEQFEAVL